MVNIVLPDYCKNKSILFTHVLQGKEPLPDLAH